MSYRDDLRAAQDRIAALEEEVRRLKECQSKWHFQPHPDVKECPDCGGTNWLRPNPAGKKAGWWHRLWRRLHREPDATIQAGGDVNIAVDGAGKIKGLRGYLPSEPPPPRPAPPAFPVPPPGGSGVKPPKKTAQDMQFERAFTKLELLETKLDRVLAKLYSLEVHTSFLEDQNGRMAAGR